MGLKPNQTPVPEERPEPEHQEREEQHNAAVLQEITQCHQLFPCYWILGQSIGYGIVGGADDQHVSKG